MASAELLNIQKHYGKTRVLKDIFSRLRTANS